MSANALPARSHFLRILSSNIAGLDGSEIAVADGGPVTIGRDNACTVVLKDPRVSREHARIEPLPEGGFHLIDKGSANGVWVGSRQVTDLPLENGTQFRIGETVLEFVAPTPPPAPEAEEKYASTMMMKAAPVVVPPPPPPEPPATAMMPPVQAPVPAPAPPPPPPPPPAPIAPAFVVRVVQTKSTAMAVGTEFTAAGASTIGRGDDCQIVLRDDGASRKHARIEPLPDGKFKVTDTGSANGTWIETRRVQEEVVAAGQRFRIGDSFLECHPPAEKKLEAGATGIISDLGQLMAGMASMRIENAGEAIAISGSKVVLLNDPGFSYYIVSGKVEIFTVTVKDGVPLGARNHFMTLEKGQAFFGMDLRHTADSGFIASGKSGTQVRRIPIAELRQISTDKHVGEVVAGLVDKWVAGMAARLTRDVFPKPEIELRVEAGVPATLAKGKRARASAGVLWIETEAGALTFIGMSTLMPDADRFLFPLTPTTWIEPAGETEGIPLEGSTSVASLQGSEMWVGLDAFHQALCECEFINKRLALVDEIVRLDAKAKQSEAAKDKAYEAIGAVLAGKHLEPADVGITGTAEPVLQAVVLVGKAGGIRVRPPAESRALRTFEDNLAAIATASRFRTRRIVLRGDWWTRDQGPILAVLEGVGTPVALLPKGPRAYEFVDPAAKTRTAVTPELASKLTPFGYTFYRGFPSGELDGRSLLKFGARGLSADFLTILAMGVMTGVLGAATPFLTGQMVDSAIPQGERALLVQLGLGMLVSALASAAFKITQATAVCRVESRMDYTLQAAIWDRLLDLPSEFFRKFGAGDLAERAAGVNAIRGLVSRAGVTGILSSFSSVAYVVLMCYYSFKLAAVAMLLTFLLVTMTTIGNYLQLKHQREQTAVQGKLVGLVLQFITGVAKVRVCAAENHAFRVWAQRFSTQKTIGFAIGSVQNVVATFSSAFPVLSSLGIFAALWYFKTSAPPGEAMVFTTGTFIAFNGAFGSFTTAVQSLADASLSLLRVVPVYERLKPILDAVPESDDSKAHPGKLRGEISVSHLSFRYREDAPWILKDISFKIEAGQFCAFVGGSGCGKSTMMRLLLGFEKPGLGAIYYDGQDLSTLDVRALRQQLGVVLQESRVLPTDIFRNIVGTTSHTMDEAWEAAEMAGLAEDVRAMPMGMHTVVSEGGGTFSGGQRQRLLIARALVNKPRIIYFDEATSALDNKTQAVVTQSMDRFDSTRIVIAHRLSTIVNADKIFYFEGGAIRESGSYEELMAKNGLFADLARRQVA